MLSSLRKTHVVLVGDKKALEDHAKFMAKIKNEALWKNKAETEEFAVDVSNLMTAFMLTTKKTADKMDLPNFAEVEESIAADLSKLESTKNDLENIIFPLLLKNIDKLRATKIAEKVEFSKDHFDLLVKNYNSLKENFDLTKEIESASQDSSPDTSTERRLSFN
ncbi:MAG TPA: hypothetical protein VLI69_00420 [Gammaproteobacteria bacterium]|nr:hypothetical protein [Gammaproteobacteria bacterium]